MGDLPPEQQQAALQSQQGNQAFAIPLRRPLPYIANAQGGAIDAITVANRQVRLPGWTPTIGPGRKLFFTGFDEAPLLEIASVQLPDEVGLYQPPDILASGFQATLTFASAQAAQAACTTLCALVPGHLPGQQHQFLQLPIAGSQHCQGVLMPATTRSV